MGDGLSVGDPMIPVDSTAQECLLAEARKRNLSDGARLLAQKLAAESSDKRFLVNAFVTRRRQGLKP